jgi:hypothetical protein
MNALPRKLIMIGLLMLLVGAVLPFLIVIGEVRSTFFLNFMSYFASVIGLFLGFIGIAMYIGDTRKNDDWRK